LGPRGIPKEVRQFIADHISSVAQLEVLLLMHAEPGVPRTPDDVAAALRIDRDWAASEMVRLARGGLLAASDAKPGGYCYGPKIEATARAVDGLAQAFSTHRVSVITLIFASPDDPVGRFADAFKLRRDERDEGG
jgi:hypothetical protein